MARRFGLREDVRVCTGGHDHLCAALAEDLKEGEVLNSMGTSEVYIGFLTQLPDQDLLYKKGIQLDVFKGNIIGYAICLPRERLWNGCAPSFLWREGLSPMKA